MADYIKHTPATGAYTREIEAVLPQLLARMDRDRLSPTFGIADRQYWAWKLIDFPNATFQGAANGLAHLQAAGLLTSHIATASIASRIAALIDGTRRVTRRNGSLEEAFPYEQSFCVTALVAFDLLRARDDLPRLGLQALEPDVDRTVAPLIGFLRHADETHGFISNHLATAAAALLRWHRLTGDTAARDRGQMLLERILSRQSPEGWFPEYEGCDPGYQTLCLTYLADIAVIAPSQRLSDALRRCVGLVWNFAHPDGSFGGIYGSRCTRIYYPAGIEALASTVLEARALADFMRQAIARHATVPLRAIDAPNLVPLFNTYCWAARLAAQRSNPAADVQPLDVPAMRPTRYRLHLPHAGLLIDHTAAHHTIISTHKGGVISHFVAGQLQRIDTGAALRDATGTIYTSQTYAPENGVSIDDAAGILKITSRLRQLKMPLPSPLNFIALRVLAMTILRIGYISNLIKQLLARLLITAKRRDAGSNVRTIKLGTDLVVTDDSQATLALRKIDNSGPFSAIHMASQGYWQLSDDRDGSGCASRSDTA